MTQRSSHRAATRHQTCRSALHISLTALAVLSALAAGMPGEVRAQEAATQITLPAQSLDDALIQLGRQTSLQFFYTPETVFGLQAPAVSGNMTPEQALQRLLQGTPVQYRLDGRNVTLTRAATTATTLSAVTVRGRTDDEIGHDNVYEKDISNLYVDRQYLERYRGISVGDVFAGMDGVYNGDNRNGAALFPNIRGLQGNGRIPITVDGTSQSIDVWMTMQGINNRNYVDPNLFRSIMVEKGPSMTRGLKNGIGGSVNIETINAGDIIQGDKNWGIELKLGTASNSVKSNMTDPHSLVGMDYRDIPGAQTSILYQNPGLSFNEPMARLRERSEVERFNFDDRKAFIAAGYKHEFFDVLAAYSYNSRGNYFAGTKGADKYMERGANDLTGDNKIAHTSIANLYGAVAKVFGPGMEVPYTSSRMESVLLKNNWYLPNNHTINLSFSRSKLDFAELPPNMADWTLWGVETGQEQGVVDQRSRLSYPFPNTLVDQDTYRLAWQWKPEHSQLIDLEASVWRTESRSDRYQNGDVTYQVNGNDIDRAYDQWSFLCYYYNMMCDSPPAKDPNVEGKIFIGTLQQTKSTRTGFDLSNRFQLSDNLALTAAGDFQYERQRDHIPVETHVTDSAGFNRFLGPVSGRRQEYGLGVNLDWQATDRLQLSAGVRYGSYWGFDDELDEKRRNQHPHWKSQGNAAYQRLSTYRIATEEELALYQNDRNAWIDYAKENNIESSIGSWSQPRQYQFDPSAPQYVIQHTHVPLIDSSKADRTQNPFYNGTYDLSETVDGYEKYIPTSGLNPEANFVKEPAADVWQRPVKRRHHAWSSQLVASYQLTDHARVYSRYASMVRFPSLYETASGDRGLSEGSASGIRPERNQAWEIGYVQDLSHLFEPLQVADVKVSYYHNTIRNFIDRNVQARAIQFDRKVMSGIEFQSRLDTGRFHAGLDVTYRLKQETCDKDYAVTLSPYYNRMPECMDGGFPRNLSFVSLQPKYSINVDLGVRLLNNALDIGTRLRYHSGAENKKLDRLLQGGVLEAYDGTIRPYYWDPVKLIDLYAEYRFNRNVSMRVTVENLTDRYYLDPLSKSPLPGPGRTIMADVGIRF
ncbi:TonB-dependent receptor [Paracandidimonas soli]|uniref:Hemoglobin/transferrin/lactoferrin receptor protein n=1 Tax=Paracandidimonas soli TaxID=1917182 RepID=A0A4R3V307_9BURK|nr:TonB-dependent receptor [Paracandidimonas soli]TCU99196.1 hemoglobin/transferrin/lactoferrin receptor protein [Paracandidimonas soli]